MVKIITSIKNVSFIREKVPSLTEVTECILSLSVWKTFLRHYERQGNIQKARGKRYEDLSGMLAKVFPSIPLE